MRLWHLTSLDAPTVAVVWMLAFAWAAHVHLPLWLPAVLALAAWSIYIGDRLLDAHKAQTPLRPRHHFHWEHRRIFTPLALTAAVAAISIVFCAMPVAARERNSALAVAALAYFTSVHSPWRLPGRKTQHRLPKELLVGILFTLACATPTLARVNWGFNLPRVLCVLLALFGYIALAWLNCYAIECWESDIVPQKSSIFHLATALTAAALLAAAVAFTAHFQREAAILVAAAFAAAMLAFLDRHKLRLNPVSLRAAADLVLLAPIVLLAIR